MKQAVVLIGVGEVGGVFARGLLRAGYPVYPIIRDQGMEEMAASLPSPELVLVAVGEKDLPACLERVPENWKGRIGLLQNELLPADWAGIPNPTAISVWFEKKPGMDAKQIIPSPVFGPRAGLLALALQCVGLDARTLENEQELLFELVVKNLYILTSNIAGLRHGGTVGALWSRHQGFARQVAEDVIRLQEKLCGQEFDHERLVSAMVNAFEQDPLHQCMGRSAPARLARALEHASSLDLELPTLREIHAEQASNT